jgi:hypothetical protein
MSKLLEQEMAMSPEDAKSLMQEFLRPDSDYFKLISHDGFTGNYKDISDKQKIEENRKAFYTDFLPIFIKDHATTEKELDQLTSTIEANYKKAVDALTSNTAVLLQNAREAQTSNTPETIDDYIINRFKSFISNIDKNNLILVQKLYTKAYDRIIKLENEGKIKLFNALEIIDRIGGLCFQANSKFEAPENDNGKIPTILPINSRLNKIILNLPEIDTSQFITPEKFEKLLNEIETRTTFKKTANKNLGNVYISSMLKLDAAKNQVIIEYEQYLRLKEMLTLDYNASTQTNTKNSNSLYPELDSFAHL